MAKYVSAIVPERLALGTPFKLTGHVAPARLQALELSRDGWGVVVSEPIARHGGYLTTFIGCDMPPDTAVPEEPPAPVDPLLIEIRALIAELQTTNKLLRGLQK
jgi:hypothetical protein